VRDKEGRLAKWRELGLDNGESDGKEAQRIAAFLRRDDVVNLLEAEEDRADIEARATIMEEREERARLYKKRLQLWQEVLDSALEALGKVRQQIREGDNIGTIQAYSKLVDVLRKLVPMDIEEEDVLVTQREREAIARSIGFKIPDELIPRA